MSKRILLIGGGGHCGSVLDCLLSSGGYDEIGIVDNERSSSILGVPVIGTDDDLPALRKAGWTDAFITVGSIESTCLRRRLYQMVRAFDYHFPVIIDPSAVIARQVRLREGVFVGKRTVINTGTEIGVCAIINTGAIVDHHCRVGDFSHISGSALLCGGAAVGNDTHVGAGTVIRHGITVGNNVLLGISSVVVKNVPDNVTAYGNPCRVAE